MKNVFPSLASACVLPLLLIRPAFAQQPLSGEFHGASVCTDLKLAPACKNEVVVYVLTRKGANISMEAFKIVAGERLSMGVLELQWDPAAKQWIYDLDAPNGFKGRWYFTSDGDKLEGGAIERASGAHVRRALAVRKR